MILKKIVQCSFKHKFLQYISFNIQVRNVAQIIQNKNSGFEYDSFTVENDFVILKLGTALDFNDDVQPACLPPSENYLDINSSEERCFTSGWGALNEGKYNP